MVGDDKTKGQAVPRTAAGKQFGASFWTERLAALGLESPGYHETVQKMKDEGRIKNKKQ